MTNQQAKELVQELVGDAGIPAGPIHRLNDGYNNGTYATKELVYAYAMWISPAFNLKVIRTFDALVTGQLHQEPDWDDPKVLRGKLIDFSQRVETLQLESDKAKAEVSNLRTHRAVVAPLVSLGKRKAADGG